MVVSYNDNVVKGHEQEEAVLTSYKCDTLFCSRREGRQSRDKGGNHRRKKMES